MRWARPRRFELVLLADVGLLIALSLAVMHGGAVLEWDVALNGALGPYRTGTLLAVFLWISGLGTAGTAIVVTIAGTGLLRCFGRRAVARIYWIVFAGTEASTWALKFAVARVRPPFIPEASAISPSFPSAHTAAAAAVYGFLACILAAGAGRRAIKFYVFGTAILAIGLVSWSRIFLSVHYASDVLAGLLVAGAWLLVGARMLARIDEPPGGPR